MSNDFARYAFPQREAIGGSGFARTNAALLFPAWGDVHSPKFGTLDRRLDETRCTDLSDKFLDRFQLRPASFFDDKGLVDFHETIGKRTKPGARSRFCVERTLPVDCE